MSHLPRPSQSQSGRLLWAQRPVEDLGAAPGKEGPPCVRDPWRSRSLHGRTGVREKVVTMGSRRKRVPADPEARAYWYLGWEKRNGHLPCGVRNCADCVATLAATEADFQ